MSRGTSERVLRHPGASASAATSFISLPRLRQATRFGLLVGTVWTLLALLSIGQTALALGVRGQPVHWPALVTLSLADWYTCALFLPALFALARRFPVGDGHWRVSVPVHLAASAVFVVAKYTAFLPLLNHFAPHSGATLPRLLAANAVSELMIFWALMGTVHAVEYYGRFREREAAAFTLAARLAEAQLAALRSQLRPHFLFNTLNAVSALMHRDPEAADRMLGQLADLLRATLEQGDAHEVSLGDELALLDCYIGIMRVRYGPRLAIEIDVPAGLTDALVPALLLQPLVENAIDHGIAPRPGPGRVSVSATLIQTGTASRVQLTVSDDGLGLTAALGGAANSGSNCGLIEGIGLSNTRQRLAQLYGQDQAFRLISAAGKGTSVTVELPLRHAHGRQAPDSRGPNQPEVIATERRRSRSSITAAGRQ